MIEININDAASWQLTTTYLMARKERLLYFFFALNRLGLISDETHMDLY